MGIWNHCAPESAQTLTQVSSTYVSKLSAGPQHILASDQKIGLVTPNIFFAQGIPTIEILMLLVIKDAHVNLVKSFWLIF